jgi:magnesium-transporting ATPase (P-type)
LKTLINTIAEEAALPFLDVQRDLGAPAGQGLSTDEVVRRQAQFGPNAVSSHRARLIPVLWHQLRSPLLGLLLAAAVASYFVGERGSAVIIGVIVGLSVGLGFVNEYRAEKAAEALHSQIHHETVVVRDGARTSVDVTDLVPGDLVELRLGDIVPADLRLVEVTGLVCDESVLTGESQAVEKGTDPVPAGTALAELSDCALMGTVVSAGSGRGTVVCHRRAHRVRKHRRGTEHAPARHRVPGRIAPFLPLARLRRGDPRLRPRRFRDTAHPGDPRSHHVAAGGVLAAYPTGGLVLPVVAHRNASPTPPARTPSHPST